MTNPTKNDITVKRQPTESTGRTMCQFVFRVIAAPPMKPLKDLEENAFLARRRQFEPEERARSEQALIF